ncbi:hypothetical protein GQ457_02G043470 [Hibiscus cannabinus]
MMANQAWNIIKNPDSLLVRVLQSVYFSNEVDVICSLPIVRLSCNDELVWLQHKDMKYYFWQFSKGVSRKDPHLSNDNIEISLHWQPTCVGVVKCNCDASYDLVTGEAGDVVIIRNEVIQVLGGFSTVQGLFDKRC